MNDETIDTAGAVSAYLNPNQDMPARAAKASMMVAADANPDFEAELRRASVKTGVPLDSARAYPEDVKKQAALAEHDFDALAQQFPGTTKFLAEPENARIAHDDVANLSSTESTIGPIRGPKPTFFSVAGGLLKSLPTGAAMAREGIRMQLADLFGQKEVMADAKGKYSQLSLDNQVATPEFEGSTARGAYSGGTSLLRALPGLAASIASKSPTPMLAAIGVQTESDAYGKYRNRGATAGEALLGGAAEGAVEVGTELLPMSFLVKNMGKVGAGHFLTGLLAREVPGEQVATLVQDAIDTAIANPDKTWKQYLDERPGAAYETLIATVTQAGVMEGAHVAMARVQGKSQEAQHATQVGEALAQFNDVAAASKVRERDAGTAQAFFQSLMQDGRDSVWITPQALAESGMLEQVAQAVPSVASQLEQAAATGSEIRIPLADLMANLAGPEIATAIIPHLADEPGGFTQTTAAEFLQSGAAQQLAEEVARTLEAKAHDDAFTASREKVAAGVLDQLNTAGRFAPQVNQAYASMVGNFYAVQAAKLGISPEDMATRYPLQVKAESMPGARTLEQPGAYTPELIVQHNLTESNLLHAHKLGGMAVPSLAITRAAHPMTNFGEITMLGSKEMVDPKKAGNKVFGSDIYSPRYPSIGHKVDRATLKTINDTIKPFKEFGGSDIYPSEIGNDAVSGLLERNAVKAAALAEMGVEVKPVLVDGKLDEWKTTMALRHAIHDHDAYGKVEAFARGLLEKAGAEERIFTGYSRTGNQTFVPHTLANVIKILQKELRGGENFNYGVGTVRSKFAPQFKSIEQIIKGKDKLVDSKTFEKVKDEIGKEFDAVIESLKPFHASSSTFGFSDTVAMMMSDSAKSGVPRALDMNGFKDVPVAEQKAIAEFLNKLRTLPTEYFEAKALRAVPLGEFKTAVVPEGTSQAVLDALAKEGVTDIRTYKKGDEADRAAKIQSADHLLFQSGRAIENTPDFKVWFGGSEVVDRAGKPLIVYHGTTADIAEFKPGTSEHNEGIFFTENPHIASTIYANGGAGVSTDRIRAKLKTMDGFDTTDPTPEQMDAAWKWADGVRRRNRSFDWDPEDLGTTYADQIADYLDNAALDGHHGEEIARLVGEVVGASTAKNADGANVVPVYLSLQHPLEIDGTGKSFDDGEQAGWLAKARAEGHDGVIIRNYDDGGTGGFENYQSAGRHTVYIAFHPEQVKSATGNDGTFDANDPSILSQGERGSLSFGDDITQQPSIITLLAGADLSTFLHESGHFFLEVLNDVASRADAPAEMKDDMAAILKWFGVEDLAAWNAMDLEGKRPHHEAFARGFESYLFEGKAPTSDLAGLFSRFRSWMVNVYKSLTALNVELTPEVRGVFDRMLASSEAIAQAEREAGFAGMFGTRPEFMSDDEWTAYRALTMQASTDAAHELETRSLKDMQWLGNAKAKVLRDLQREHNFKRQQVHNEVRREVMAEPVYQAWQFLTLRGSESTRAWPTPEFKLDAKMLDTRVDNLYKAIAKLGGLNREEVKTKWGVDHKDMPDSGVFGKPILRKNGGLSIERMAEKLVEEHYLDQHDLAEFEDKFDRQRGGQDQYSWEYQYNDGNRAPAEPLGDSNYHGKLHTPMLKYMFGDDSPVVQQLIKARMTATDGGLDPDIVAEMIPGFQSGREMVDQITAVPPPSTMINQLVDQRMLERYGDLTDQAAIDRAVNEALHQRAHAKFVATEMAALRKAAGQPAVLAKAAQMYAAQIVNRTPIKELRPHLFTAAAKRAGQAADKAFTKGDVQEAAAQKQIQLINTYAAKAAMDARETVEKTMVRFRTITNGNNHTVAKTRDLDMVMATRAILAEFGIGTRGKKAAEYLEAVDAYDPAMARVLRERIDAAGANAKPVNELTIEELQALRDEVESLWFMAKRSRQMEVDGDLLDRKDIQDLLRARLEEIGIPDLSPGEKHAITPGEVRITKLQSLRAAMRRIEAWAGAKDGQEEMGPFRRFVWNTIKDPADAYRAEKANYLRAYRALLDPIAPSLVQMKIAAPELNYTFGFDQGGMGKVELLHAILHTGNIGNKKKLLLGRGWATETPEGGMNTSRWDSFVARMIDEGTLTRADFDFAQGVWDLMEAMKPQAQKAHRDVFGRYFDEVTADPFSVTMKGGQVVQYAGGYVPAIADSRIVTDAKTRAILEEELSSLANVMPTTSKGFTKSRVEYNRPLLLDLRLLAQHIDKVLLFSHLEGPVRDVRRILGSDTVASALHKVDPAAYDSLLTPWLNRAARQQVETPVAGDSGTMRFFSVVRSRAGMAAMFANVSNTAQQITGFSIAALRVKPVHLLAAAADFIRAPRQTAQAVAEQSPYMANRMENEVGAMTNAINDILLNPGVYESAKAWGARHTYFLQSAVDNVMGPIIWHGAYNQALETAPGGLSESELALYARRLADSAVRETQGSTLPEDISRIETGNAFVRIFTQFAGYFNMQANILGTEFARIPREMGLKKGLGRGFYVLLFGFFVPAWVAQAIALAFRGGPDDEDKNGAYLDDWFAQVFGWGTLRAGTAMVPVVGQAANSLANTFNHKPYDDKISTGPAISMIESAVSVPSDLYKLATGNGSATKTVRDVATLVTLMTGIPVAGAARPVVYAVDVASGKARPTGAVDTARGAITGTASPASKGK